MRATAVEDLLDRIAARAENLFRSKQFMCAEAVLLAVTRGLGQDLPAETAIALAAPFSDGMGGSGCTCGALSGAQGQRKEARRASRELHRRFTAAYRSVCCRVLTKELRNYPKRHFNQCAAITGATARMTARLILEKEQTLTAQVDLNFLDDRHSLVGGLLKRMLPN